MNNMKNPVMFDFRILTSVIILLVIVGATGCASLPTDVERNPSFVVNDTNTTRLGTLLVPLTEKHPGLSGFYGLGDGIDAFVARMMLAEVAEKSLDIQYYIWHTDTTGTLLIDRIIRAADRGVRVRLLLDDLDTAGKDHGLVLLDLHPNIEVRVYNPFAQRDNRYLEFITDLSRVNRRMHNKSFTADNQATIVGGRNIGNEYFDATSHSAFADLDVLAIGPVVDDVSYAFDEYWNSEWVFPINAIISGKSLTQLDYESARIRLTETVLTLMDGPYIEAVKKSDLLRNSKINESEYQWGKAILLYDSPNKASGTEMTAATHIGPNLAEVFKTSEKELIIVSPYFVPGKELVGFLGDIVDSGVKVRVLTNSLAANDVGVVHSGYMRYRVGLLKRGVELYEYKPTQAAELKEEKTEKRWSGSSKASLHAKTFAVDQQYIFVGSFNLDPRSVLLNTEMGILLESSELGVTFAEGFEKIINTKAYRLELITTPAEDSMTGFEENKIRWISYENGQVINYVTEPETSMWQRFVVTLMSIFVIESFL